MSGQTDDQRRRHADERNADEARSLAAEERARGEAPPTDLGEVRAHKRVVEEEETVPVELQRDEVRVEQRDVAERPAGGDALFQEGTIRVPVRGEEAVVTKEAVVTGEVAIGGARATEHQDVSDTARAGPPRARFQQAWGGVQQRFAQRQGGPGSTAAPGHPRPLEEVEAPDRGTVRAGRRARMTPWRSLPSPVEDTQLPDGAGSAAGAGHPRSRTRWALLGLGLGVLTPLVALALPSVRQALAGQLAHVRTARATWAAERERRQLRQTVARLERELARCRRQGRR